MGNLIKCNKCGRELPPEEFYVNKTKPNGHSTYCKECTREYNKTCYSAKKPTQKNEVTSFQETSTNDLIKELIGRKQDIIVNPTPRDLILRLKAFGYEGTLEYTEKKVISLKNFN